MTMKILPTNDITLEKAVKVTSDELVGSVLWRYDLDCYAVSTNPNSKPIIAFISKEFSKLLNCIETPLSDFAFTRSKCQCCENAHQFDELRILAQNKESYMIDSNGVVSKICELGVTECEDRLAFSMTELWGLPDCKPYHQLLVTLKFSEQLDPFLSVENIQRVVDSLWYDINQHQEHILIEKPISISGEYGNYAALSLYCGRIVLLSTEEQDCLEQENTDDGRTSP